MDAAEAETAPGWEVLDPEETEKEAGSLEAGESSGLVEALVGVVHKG